jgi:hypothetical protein
MPKCANQLTAQDWEMTKKLLARIVRQQSDQEKLLWSEAQKIEHAINQELETI